MTTEQANQLSTLYNKLVNKPALTFPTMSINGCYPYVSSGIEINTTPYTLLTIGSIAVSNAKLRITNRETGSIIVDIGARSSQYSLDISTYNIIGIGELAVTSNNYTMCAVSLAAVTFS